MSDTNYGKRENYLTNDMVSRIEPAKEPAYLSVTGDKLSDELSVAVL